MSSVYIAELCEWSTEGTAENDNDPGAGRFLYLQARRGRVRREGEEESWWNVYLLSGRR